MPPLSPNVLAMPQGSVRYQRRQRSELERVAKNIGDGQKYATVILVCRLIEKKLVSQYLADVVGFSRVVEDGS